MYTGSKDDIHPARVRAQVRTLTSAIRASSVASARDLTNAPHAQRRGASLAALLVASMIAACPMQTSAAEVSTPGTCGRSSQRPGADLLRVTWSGNVLEIHAEDAPLADVLLEVQCRTGASLIVPATLSDRISADIAQAPGEALRSLLDHLDYDYLVVTSARPPRVVERIVLSSRTRAVAAEQKRGLSTATPHFASPQAAPTGFSDIGQARDHQQQRFEQAFGACIAQGCDAS